MTRPNITVVLAMSADGKIGDVYRNPVNFPSQIDFAHLEKQVALADGVLFGAGTLRSGGTAMRIQTQALINQRIVEGKAPQPIQIVCSRTGSIEPTLPIFKQNIPRWLLTTVEGAIPWKNKPQFDQVLAYSLGSDSGELDWPRFFDDCIDANLQHLVLLGGGALIGNFLEQNYIDELWLTVCPVLIGGRKAPTPIDGNGISQDLAPRLSLNDCQKVGDELFLHYTVLREKSV